MPYTHLLEQIEIFADLDNERLRRISAICTERLYEPGDVIFHENTQSDELFVILQGEVEIQVDPKMLGVSADESPGPTTVATLWRDQSFGEIALVDKGLRSASARCAAPGTRLLAIQRDDLIELCQRDFEMGYLVMRNMAGDLAFKIRQTDLMVRFRDTRDAAVFEQLYHASHAGLLGWIVQRMAVAGMQADPLELLQDTFVNIYRYAGTFREDHGNTFRGWARTISANVVRRASCRRRPHLSLHALPGGSLEPRDDREGPHDALAHGEQRESLARAWTLLLLHYAAAARNLSARDREALHLVEVEELPYAEVARRLRVRSSNMKMIVFRSRKRIRAQMLQAFARGEQSSRGEDLAPGASLARERDAHRAAG